MMTMDRLISDLLADSMQTIGKCHAMLDRAMIPDKDECDLPMSLEERLSEMLARYGDLQLMLIEKLRTTNDN